LIHHFSIHLIVLVLLLLHHLHSSLLILSSFLKAGDFKLKTYLTLIYSLLCFIAAWSCFYLSIIIGSGCMSKMYYFPRPFHLLTGMTRAAKVFPLTTRRSYIMFCGAILLYLTILGQIQVESYLLCEIRFGKFDLTHILYRDLYREHHFYLQWLEV